MAYPIKGSPCCDNFRANLKLPALDFAEWNDRMIEVPDGRSARFTWLAARAGFRGWCGRWIAWIDCSLRAGRSHAGGTIFS